MVDLNSDLGEGYGVWSMADDAALLEVVTSANIACGFHAGDPTIMRRTTATAVERGVSVGAHVGYADRRGFGRRDIAADPAEVRDDVLYQIGALDAFARAAGSRVSYVKAHGALYNRIAVDEVLAAAVVDAVLSYDRSLVLLTLAGSVAADTAAAAGLEAVAEGFADRAYTPQGRLVARSQPGAVLHDPGEVARRAVSMATRGTVLANDGSTITVAVASLCVHGDSPGAVELARAVRHALTASGVTIAPFAR